jgi:(4S)-4-hydroxy-5-phosphonooxypentane-2,3-dione isomerase
MIIITVEFEVHAHAAAAFIAGMTRQASVCRATEPGCLQFDVATDPDRPDHIFIYEVFADAVAVAHHNDTPHFHAFRAEAAPMIVSRRLSRWVRVASA